MMFGELLKIEREKQKLSQRGLGLISGLSNTYIANLEMGFDKRSGKKPIPTIETIKRLESALELPANYLINNSEYSRYSEDAFSLHPEQMQYIGKVEVSELSSTMDIDIMRQICALHEYFVNNEVFILYGGDYLSENTKELMRIALEMVIKESVLSEKKRFTSRRFRRSNKK